MPQGTEDETYYITQNLCENYTYALIIRANMTFVFFTPLATLVIANIFIRQRNGQRTEVIKC